MPTTPKEYRFDFRLKAFQEIRELIAAKMAESITARRHEGGYVDVDDEIPGRHVIHLMTQSGIETYCGARNITERQSRSAAAHDVRPQPIPEIRQTAPTVSDFWQVARTQTACAEKRIEALRELTLVTSDVPQFVADELMRNDLSEEWRNLLIFLSEDLCFPSDLQPGLGNRLLSIASTLQLSTKAGDDKAAWAALRRATTMLNRNPVPLLPFLDRKGAVDMRSVALRCIQRMFEAAPPEGVDSRVVDRVAQFATKFLDPDVFTSGETALIAKNAIFALAALGDSRLSDAIDASRNLNRRWLSHQVKNGLKEMLENWHLNGVVAPNPAVNRIEQQITNF